MEFQLSYFKSWKMMLWKCCTQYASKFGKLSSVQRTRKGQFSFQSQKGNNKDCSNYCTIALISHATKSVSSLQSLSCVRSCYAMNPSMPGLPVHHQLPESTQTHVHWVGDAIQPSHPLSSPSLPALNLSQHEGLFKWVSSLLQVAKVLEFQLQHESFQRRFRTDFLQDGLVGCLCSPRDSQESSPTPQFKSINSLALSILHSPTLTSIHDHRKNHNLD